LARDPLRLRLVRDPCRRPTVSRWLVRNAC
jgi:hypothetical protein